mmetsp:Transcript_1634/g.4909  ORF Transcript_1634/g.4909 Transcript_1634/m.4909 type:complete len:237 (-) Transcript_1634:130-840(-)|eukprot:CAMPEP_0198736010 /NCGR_PEP_ID=MMETSP1475-20131203/63001_1 /TAXON_ID= ORGANISM="Unidentified sp., Strain CCMP1999" /NCGR_SAMPLE_ID=MMETSP1475 /ASSEMBLY_ACC=CAM_ASM_001111 /LENGTH=236 /DNA_ID=CAMNT_0044499755 /DNA_START=208 /DNA_END=918 /DNA_ORIENTATION=-
MISSLRRQVQRKVSGPTPLGNPEIEEYTQKLLNVSSALEESSRSIIITEMEWKKVYTQVKKQFENFVNVYPDNDDYRGVFKRGADACEAIGENYSNEDLSLPGRKIDFKVQEYLIEINTVLKELKCLEELHRNYVDSVDRLNSVQKSKRGEGERLGKWEERAEAAKQDYHEKSEDILNKMKRIYGKRKIMYNASYVAYWRSQMTFMSMLQDQMQETTSYVQKHENQFLNMDVSKLL